MANNLYIYKVHDNGVFNREVWRDVKITEGYIVTKKDAANKLKYHSLRKKKDNLDTTCIIRTGFPISKVTSTEYISFNESLTDEIKSKLIDPFIQRYNEEQEELKKKIDEIEKLKNNFLNLF